MLDQVQCQRPADEVPNRASEPCRCGAESPVRRGQRLGHIPQNGYPLRCCHHRYGQAYQEYRGGASGFRRRKRKDPDEGCGRDLCPADPTAPPPQTGDLPSVHQRRPKNTENECENQRTKQADDFQRRTVCAQHRRHRDVGDRHGGVFNRLEHYDRNVSPHWFRRTTEFPARSRVHVRGQRPRRHRSAPLRPLLYARRSGCVRRDMPSQRRPPRRGGR